jgi:hypothetical protein
MKNVVTFETAKRLKDAGFPQPEPKAGQGWYDPDFGLFLCGKRCLVYNRQRNIFYLDTGHTLNKQITLFQECVFAPTATDILRQISGVMLFDKGKAEMWIMLNHDDKYFVFHEGDPAELAARAWLKANEKQPV